MASAQKVRGHPGSHVSQSDESDFHIVTSVIQESFVTIVGENQCFGGAGRGGLGPKALAVSRWGRAVLESWRWRASAVAARSWCCGLVRQATTARTSSMA